MLLQICGSSSGGDEHVAVELDENACKTLKENRPGWKVAKGDVADPAVWNPARLRGLVSLLVGGVPCPPFTNRRQAARRHRRTGPVRLGSRGGGHGQAACCC
jgi:site-specific DNA-cytosine methylase